MPDAPRAHALTHEQVVRAGETEALQETEAASNNNNSVTAEGRNKGCQTFIITELEQCVGWPCCDEWYCEYSTTIVTICGGSGGGGGGDDPYPDGGGGTGGDAGGSGSGECTIINPPPGSDCEPANPCDGTDPPSYCEIDDVNDLELCSNDPLKDMKIRAIGCIAQGTRSVEGGRFQTDARPSHDGIDLLADVGTNLYAIKGGDVEAVNNDPDGWGDYVVIKAEGENQFFLYAHLSAVNVEEGDSIIKGNLIGETGTSGNASDDPCNGGPSHLHLEVLEGASQWYNADPADPENYLGTQFDDDTGTAISDSCPD
jgi:murein DD-endopeptidase MepM/ murein hydrolase activator NlpD